MSSSISSAAAAAAASVAATASAAGFALPNQIPPEFQRYQAEIQKSIKATATPLNLTILLLFAGLLYIRFRQPSNVIPTLPGNTPITFRTFTPRTLLPFNGEPSKPYNPDGKVYLAVKGKVYDVSSGRNFYGPGGPYENFAGRDATRGLACQSFDEDMLTKNLDGPLDDLKGLGDEEIENLNGWVERFEGKYLVVGKLMAFNKSSMPFQ